MKQFLLKGNKYFAIFKSPYNKLQHSNQQKGLDEYITVLNFETGYICNKKLYLHSKKGLFFKHTGYPVSYIDDMILDVNYIPYQYYFTEIK